MKQIFKTTSNRELTLNRGRKYTRLTNSNGSVLYSWLNENIDNILGSFENQIKHFEQELK